ncbi:MAG TPA: cupin domain-containing protein [Actinomycetota bacterium]|nr:cupin domain-containing protein [Actinomycetota bacterium]
MTDGEPTTSYAIHEEPLFGLSEVMDVQKVIDETTEPWVNWTLCRVNDSLIRLGVLHGEFHWHKHDDEDEFFLLLDGDFRIELEDRTVELKPRQAFTVPRGVLHRPVVPVRSAVLMIETAGVVATGD